MIGEKKNHIDPRRVYLAGLGLALGLLAYIVELFGIQVINNLTYEKRARTITQKSDIIPAQRGLIFDRFEDFPLTTNIDSFSLTYTLVEEDPVRVDPIVNSLSTILGASPTQLRQKMGSQPSNPYIPIELMDGVSYKQIVQIAERIENYPGIHWESKPKRYYNMGSSMIHALGYIGGITNEEFQILYNVGSYSRGSLLGKIGMERQYDTLLRGKDGRRANTVDAHGRLRGVDRVVQAPVNGYNLVLTIDRNLQDLVEKALGNRKGSAVVLNPNTGEVLAMVSNPRFNPNLFNLPGKNNFGALTLNPDFPFLNRAIQSANAPASTFKILMTTALLEEGADKSRRVFCSGSLQLGNRTFNCHRRTGHGWLNLTQALAESCNIYFGTVGMELGIDKIVDYSRRLGLGELTQIDLPGEVPGIIPSPAWKLSTYNSPWVKGDTLNTTIGQGFVSLTVLQAANMLAALVNDTGKVYRPYVLKKVLNPNTGEVIEKASPEALWDNTLTESTRREVQNMLRTAVMTGSAQSAVILTDQVAIGGKTGTGEVSRTSTGWHSWYLGYGPWTPDNKGEKIVLAIMIEATNDWEWWAPKASDIIFDGYFGKRSYEETIRRNRARGIWYSRGVTLEEEEEKEDD